MEQLTPINAALDVMLGREKVGCGRQLSTTLNIEFCHFSGKGMASPSCSVLVEAIGAVLEDPSFPTTCPIAVDGLQSAKVLQDWCVSEKNTVVVLLTELLTDLEGALIL